MTMLLESEPDIVMCLYRYAAMEQGWKAFKKQARRSECPYDHGTALRSWWLEGWILALNNWKKERQVK
jgi:ribosome modulation factor